MSIFNTNLPSGNKVTFKEISFRERRQIAKKYNRNEGYLLEEVMAAAAITHVNGDPITEEWAADPISRLDNWSIPDVQYYLEVFLSINSIDETARERAQEEAKKMLGATTTPPSRASGTKPKALKVDTGN